MKRFAALGAIRLSGALKELGYEAVFDEYPMLLDPTLTPEQQAEYLSAPIFEGCGQQMETVWSLLWQSELAQTGFELAVLRYMDGRISGAFEALCPHGGGQVTVELAAKVLYPREDLFTHYEQLRQCHQILTSLLASTPASSFLQDSLCFDDRLAGFLCGEDLPDVSLKHIARLQPPEEALEPLYLYDTQLEAAAGALCGRTATHPMLQIIGQPHSGRKFFARHLAKKCAAPLLVVDSGFLQGEVGFRDRILQKLARECLLSGVWLALYGFDDPAAFESLRTGLFRLLELLPPATPLLILSDDRLKLFPYTERWLYPVLLPKPDYARSEQIWSAFSARVLGEHHLSISQLAAKMRLAPGLVWKILTTAAQRDQSVTDALIYRICYEVLDDGRYDRNIKSVSVTYRWEDLMLAAPQKRMLQDLCNQTNYRLQVMHQWGMQKKYPYGYCISALFCGAPGTGKTMAVQVIASMLGLELYKVDLSRIVDKYIGETEKRLEEVFSRAEKTNVILFFDEADSILGKRSEVKDAKDKYANTEVSYLLQRMEEYDGIVIMATNNLQNIDKAFLRRIRYVVNFPMPDMQTRKAIWISSFAPEVPQCNIDFDFLAERFEFSGGAIKNTVLNAVSYAAAENGPVSMAHMVKAVQRELSKDSQVNFTDALSTYAYLAEPM